MSNAYTMYWTRQRCDALRRLGWAGRLLETLYGGGHLSEPSFLRAGVRSGDAVYPIAVRAGVLYLLGRTRVRRILAFEDFVKQHPPPVFSESLAFDEDYRAANLAMIALAGTCTSEAVECEDSTPLHFDLPVPPDVLARLHFCSQRRERDLSQHLRNGRLVQSLGVRGIYRLSESSARELETPVLSSASAVPPTV